MSLAVMKGKKHTSGILVNKKASTAIINTIRKEVKSINKDFGRGVIDDDIAFGHMQGMCVIARKLGVYCGCGYKGKTSRYQQMECSCTTVYGKTHRKMTFSQAK